MTINDVFYKEFTNQGITFRLELRLGLTASLSGVETELPDMIIKDDSINCNGAMPDELIHGMELSKELEFELLMDNFNSDWIDVKNYILASIGDLETIQDRDFYKPNNWTLKQLVGENWFTIFDGVQIGVPDREVEITSKIYTMKVSVMSIEKFCLSMFYPYELDVATSPVEQFIQSKVYDSETDSAIYDKKDAMTGFVTTTQEIFTELSLKFNLYYSAVKRTDSYLFVESTFLRCFDFYKATYVGYVKDTMLEYSDIYIIAFIRNIKGKNTSGWLGSNSKSNRTPFANKNCYEMLKVLADSLAIKLTFYHSKTNDNFCLSFAGMLEVTQKQRINTSIVDASSDINHIAGYISPNKVYIGDKYTNQTLNDIYKVVSITSDTSFTIDDTSTITNTNTESYIIHNISNRKILNESLKVKQDANLSRLFRRKLNGLETYDYSDFEVSVSNYATFNDSSLESDLILTNAFNSDSAVDVRQMFYIDDVDEYSKIHPACDFYLSRKVPSNEISINATTSILPDSTYYGVYLKFLDTNKQHLAYAILDGLSQVYGNFIGKTNTKQCSFEVELAYEFCNFTDIGSLYRLDLNEIKTALNKTGTENVGTLAVLTKCDTDFKTMISKCTFFLTTFGI